MSENTALSKYQFLLQFKFMDQEDKNIITTTSFNVQSPNNQAYSFSPALQFTKIKFLNNSRTTTLRHL